MCCESCGTGWKKLEDPALPEELLHYAEDDDHNKVLYHNRSEDTDSKTEQVLKDAERILSACGSRYDEYSEYQLLIRAIKEQTNRDANGNLTLKRKSEGMDSATMQNPGQIQMPLT